MRSPDRFVRFPLLAGLSCALLAAIPAAAAPQGFVCVEGGGSPGNGAWAPAVFGWMTAHAGPSPDVVILGLSGTDPAAEAAFLANGAASATSLAVPAGSANDPAVRDAILAADIVWLRGGDQAQYVAQWDGTLVEDAIRAVHDAGGVVGGTSAGAHVLSSVVYDAANGGVFPDETLQDPYNVFTTFTTDFLGLVEGALVDTHFTERGRLGRLPVMLARRFADAGEDLLGIGVDDRTALCIHPDRTAEVRGEGAVTLLWRTPQTLQLVEPGAPPVVTALAHTQLTEGYVVDLTTRTVLARPAHAALPPPPSASPSFTTRDLAGDSAADAAAGEFQVLDGGDSAALFRGALQVVPGDGDLGRTVVATRVWRDTVFDENRVGGVQYALALHPHRLGLYLDDPVRLEASGGRLTVEPAVGVETALVVLDGHGVASTALSTWVSSGSSVGPRQSVALEGARLHVLRSDLAFDAGRHLALLAVPYGRGKQHSGGGFARLVPVGAPSVGAGFAIDVAGALPGSGLLFYGPGPDAAPFLGGTLLVAPPITRLAPFVLDAAGSIRVPIPVDAAWIGTTRWYQGWFRDPTHPDGTGAGLTGGLAATFVP